MNALLEIGCEEIPARFMPGFLLDLKKKAEEKLTAERIAFGKVETFGTYRRLTLYIENIAERQTDLSFEAKGPPANVAFDKDGKPTPAAIGFAKKQGISPAELKVENNYVVAKVFKKSLPTSKVLQAVFPAIITSLYQPLSMRWGSLDFKFIRPIHWIVALCGMNVVKFEIAGIKSGNKTAPHRYSKKSVGTTLVVVRLSGQEQALSLHAYKKFMLKLGVIVDQNEREGLIRQQVEAAAQKIGAKPLISEALLAEVNFLVENPIAYVGKFKPEFLKIPQEVLITSMQKNQKYFPLVDKSGRLQAQFVVVTDGCKNKGVVEGNQKVLSARLSDARFFFEEDCKMSLRMRLPDLEKVSFFEKLGTLAQKAERVASLSAWIGQRLKMDEAQLKNVHRIAMLCKADLTTKMVYEFPELQGVMGREYARLSSENPVVAEGIFEHYLPRHAEDKLPLSPEGTIVALADRIDSLVGCFSVGAVPTGSEDPYGLRRAVQGIIRIITEKKIDLLLDETIEQSYKLYKPILQGAEAVPFAAVKKELLIFIAGRLKPILLDKGVRYDVVDAVLFDCNDILDCITKAGILNRLVGESWFPGVVASADRVSRIAGSAARESVEEAALLEKEEKDLFELYNKVSWETGEAINKEDWRQAAQALAALTDPLERFFDKVLVMHKDEKIKLNRLALLKSIDKVYSRVADFKKIVIEGAKK